MWKITLPWCKPLKTVPYNCTCGVPSIRPDARPVSKARLLSQALRYPVVADMPHQSLSTRLLVPMQDWTFLSSCLVLDRPNTSDSLGSRAGLHGTLLLDCSQTRSFNSLIKSILVPQANPFFTSHSLNFFSTRISTLLFLFLLCCVSRLGKGHSELSYDTTTGVTSASRGNSASLNL